MKLYRFNANVYKKNGELAYQMKGYIWGSDDGIARNNVILYGEQRYDNSQVTINDIREISLDTTIFGVESEKYLPF